ncbi:MAG: ABC transporter substrate-binding protein [Bacteroidota bacterium]
MNHKPVHSILAFTLLLMLLPACKERTDGKEGKTYLPSGTISSDTAGLREVTFLPYWVANAQFAGYYMAREMGIYKKYGMNVEIVPYQPFYTTSDMIRDGEIDFAALWLLNAIGMKASGVDIVNIAQFSTRSSLMLLTKKSSGISKLEDMNHKKAGIWTGYELQPKALFKKYNLDVEIVPIGSTNNLFLKDGVQITNANWFDEYHSIINSGYDAEDLNTFFFADYGLNFLEDGIYCLSKKMKADPKLCADFVTATEEGWQMAYANPEQAIDLVVVYAQKMKLPVNRVHQRWMLDRYKDLYNPGGEVPTTLSEKDYLFAGNILKESGQIAEVPPFESFFHHYNQSEEK